MAKTTTQTTRIYTGANGYYIATEDAQGSHRQPRDNGARLGWDRARAERALRRAIADDATLHIVDPWSIAAAIRAREADPRDDEHDGE